MKTIISNDTHFVRNGHPSQFPGHVVERHPTSKSMARLRAFDCRTGRVFITPFQSASNISTYGVFRGQEVVIFPYGCSIEPAMKKALQQ